MKNVTYPLLMVLLIISCKGGMMAEPKITFQGIKEILPTKWEALSMKRIIFGHQSVGDNMIEGMIALMKEHPSIMLTIKETTRADDLTPGTFAHFSVGENEKAESKIRDFDAKIRQGMGEKVDIALFKFCFVDVDARTDVRKLFNEYRNTMAGLKRDYPSIIFVHVTVPLLRKEETTIKGLVKRILGGSDGFFTDGHNIRRNEYNELLLKEYAGKEPVFDIAKVSSMHPDGTREAFTASGRRFYALASEYTEDGGHLNALGRKVVAEQFLIFLARLNSRLSESIERTHDAGIVGTRPLHNSTKICRESGEKFKTE